MAQEISTGTTGTAGLEQFYPGMDDKHTIDSKGEFTTRSVSLLGKVSKKLSSDRNKQLDKIKDAAQKSVYERRVKFLNQHGNFQKTIEQLNTNPNKGRNGTLPFIDDQKLKDDIAGIKKIENDELANKAIGNKEDNKIVVSQDALKVRVQKDLTIFFAGCIKEADNPQTLQTLNHFISEEANNGGITAEKHKKLNKALKQKCRMLAKELPKKLSSLDVSNGRKTDSHSLEIEKLQYIHDLQATLRTVAPDVLDNHKNTIKKEAVNAFITGKNHLEPSSNSLRETSEILKGIESDKQELLVPILSATTKKEKITKALHRIDSDIQTTVNVMKNQLAEIGSRTEALQDATDSLMDHQKELSRITTQLKGTVRNIESRESSYLIMKENAGSKLKRRFNFFYQKARRINRHEKAQLENYKAELQQNIKEQQVKIQASKRDYTYQRMMLDKARGQFSDSYDMAPTSATDPRAVVGNSKFDTILLNLEKRGLIEESDVSASHQYFSRFAKTDISEQAVTKMAEKYEQLVEEGGYDSYQALWAISSGYNSASGNTDSDFEQEISFLKEHAELIPTRKSDIKGNNPVKPSVELHPHVASRLNESLPQNSSLLLQSGVIQRIEQALEENPKLKTKIAGVCDFFLDGIDYDGKEFKDDPAGYNQLFTDYCNALDIGIKSLQANPALPNAIKSMEEYLYQQDSVLTKTTDMVEDQTINSPSISTRTARLKKINPDDLTSFSNNGVAGYIEGIIAQSPFLENEINQIFDHFMERLESDSKPTKNNPTAFNNLFTDYYTALGVAIDELVHKNSSIDVAISQMTYHMDLTLPAPPQPESIQPLVSSENSTELTTSNHSIEETIAPGISSKETLVKPDADTLQAAIKKMQARKKSGSSIGTRDLQEKDYGADGSLQGTANRPGSPVDKMLRQAQNNANKHPDSSEDWDDS